MCHLGTRDRGGSGSAGTAVGPNGPQEHLNRSWQGTAWPPGPAPQLLELPGFCFEFPESLEFNFIDIIWQGLNRDFQGIACVLSQSV